MPHTPFHNNPAFGQTNRYTLGGPNTVTQNPFAMNNYNFSQQYGNPYQFNTLAKNPFTKPYSSFGSANQGFLQNNMFAGNTIDPLPQNPWAQTMGEDVAGTQAFGFTPKPAGPTAADKFLGGDISMFGAITEALGENNNISNASLGASEKTLPQNWDNLNFTPDSSAGTMFSPTSEFNPSNWDSNKIFNLPEYKFDPLAKDYANATRPLQEAVSAEIKTPTTIPEIPAETTTTTDTGNKDGKKVDGGAVAAAIGSGVSMFAKAIDKPQYNEKFGAYKPNHFGTMYGDSTFTSIGSSIMPGIGTAIGAGVDRIKNAIALGKKKRDYAQAANRYAWKEKMEQQQKFGEENYIGWGRFGLESKGQLINVEKNEIGLRKGGDGKYKVIWETGPYDKSHEEGGINKIAQAGDIVMPEKYINPVKRFLAAGNTSAIDQLVNNMMVESTAASINNLGYSNQSPAQQKINELVTGTAKYGAKVPKYEFGGIQGANPYTNPRFTPIGFENPVIDNQIVDTMQMPQQHLMYQGQQPQQMYNQQMLYGNNRRLV
tara:strand:- start:232 stop:1860 length:1629 start_codon:yes stop_codon:yes gene_type:complete